MDDEVLRVVCSYRVRGQADDLAERLLRSGILATVGPDLLGEGWDVTMLLPSAPRQSWTGSRVTNLPDPTATTGAPPA